MEPPSNPFNEKLPSNVGNCRKCPVNVTGRAYRVGLNASVFPLVPTASWQPNSGEPSQSLQDSRSEGEARKPKAPFSLGLCAFLVKKAPVMGEGDFTLPGLGIT